MQQQEDGESLLLEDLSFSLKDVNALTNIQLCLVQFHPEADEVAKAKAELLYWRRRNKAQARNKANAQVIPPQIHHAPAPALVDAMPPVAAANAVDVAKEAPSNDLDPAKTVLYHAPSSNPVVYANPSSTASAASVSEAQEVPKATTHKAGATDTKASGDLPAFTEAPARPDQPLARGQVNTPAPPITEQSSVSSIHTNSSETTQGAPVEQLSQGHPPTALPSNHTSRTSTEGYLPANNITTAPAATIPTLAQRVQEQDSTAPAAEAPVHGHTPPEPNIARFATTDISLGDANETHMQLDADISDMQKDIDTSMQADGIFGTEILLSDESEDAEVAQLLARPISQRLDTPPVKIEEENDNSLQTRLGMGSPTAKVGGRGTRGGDGDPATSLPTSVPGSASNSGNKRPYSEVDGSSTKDDDHRASFRARIADSDKAGQREPLSARSSLGSASGRNNDRTNGQNATVGARDIGINIRKRTLIPLEVAKTFACLFIGSLTSDVSNQDLREYILSGSHRQGIPRPVAILDIHRPTPESDGYARVFYRNRAQADEAKDWLKGEVIQTDRSRIKPLLKDMASNVKKIGDIPWSIVESWALKYLKDIIADEEIPQPLNRRVDTRRPDDRRGDYRREHSPPRQASPPPSQSSLGRTGKRADDRGRELDRGRERAPLDRRLSSRLDNEPNTSARTARDEYRPRGNYTGRRASQDAGRANSPPRRNDPTSQLAPVAANWPPRGATSQQFSQTNDLLHRFDNSPNDGTPQARAGSPTSRKKWPPDESSGLLGRMN